MHHKLPFRAFGYVRGVNENYREANQLENLVLVCRACHQRLETAGRLRTGLDGLAYALANLAPLHLMCDPSDLGLFVQRSGGPGDQSRHSQQSQSLVTRHLPPSTSTSEFPPGWGSAPNCTISMNRCLRRRGSWLPAVAVGPAVRRAWGQCWRSSLCSWQPSN